MTQYFVINRRVFPTILHLLLPIRSLWIYTLDHIFPLFVVWAPIEFYSLHWAFYTTRERNLRSEVLRTSKNPSHWGELDTPSCFPPRCPINIKILSKIVLVLSIGIWSKPLFLLLNVFPCIDLVFCSSFLVQLTVDLKILAATFVVRAISYA